MQYHLKNDKIEATFESLGAEMISLKDAKDREFLWCGDSKYWGRHSPVLFPFVGKVSEGKYRYKGAEYPMGQHGFARDMEFALVSQKEDEIWFALQSTEETKAKYPFDFRLEIGYRLIENTVRVLWKVINTAAEEPMYFSIGAHPAFLCPLEKGKEQSEYLVRFEKKEKLTYRNPNLELGLCLPQEHTLELESGCCRLKKGFFDVDTYIFENKQLQEMSLLTPEGKPYITVSFDAPLVALWSPNKEGSPFVCIEPWYGRCDMVGYKGTLEEREWGNLLEAGKIFEAYYEIHVEE